MSFILNVFFEDPFWIGVFTVTDGESARYSRVVFGSEPSDIEVYRFILKNANQLPFSVSLPAGSEEPAARNPKRRQREISRELQNRTGARKSFEAIKLAVSQGRKEELRRENRAEKAEREDRLFSLKRQKLKAKHRGH